MMRGRFALGGGKKKKVGRTRQGGYGARKRTLKRRGSLWQLRTGERTTEAHDAQKALKKGRKEGHEGGRSRN